MCISMKMLEDDGKQHLFFWGGAWVAEGTW